MDEIRVQWLSYLVSTEPANKVRAEAGLRKLYASAGMAEPKVFFWFASPFRAATASAALCASDYLWKPIIETMERSKKSREWLDGIRGEMCKSVGLTDWPQVAAAAGASLTLGHMMSRGPVKMLQPPITMKRISLYDDIAKSSPLMDDKEPLYRAERAYRSVLSGQGQWSLINPMLSQSFYNSMSYSTQAKDEAQIAGREAPALLAGLWDVAKSAGLWWPFENAVMISDRPSELYLDEGSRPHRGDGPAVVFRDGERAWAWQGRAMRQEWIETPENISPRELKTFEQSFRDYVAKHTGGAAKTAKPKYSAILAKDLGGTIEEKLEVLRRHNQSGLPLYDRYIAGEHEKVWVELVSLGASVRQDPHAADALAVAYETMRRVDANVKKVTMRLKESGYRFSDKPHIPPGKKTRKYIDKLEKLQGTLPLSLRAFYEIVGSVDWMGSHPTLAQEGDTIASDPLVVFDVEGVLNEAESEGEEAEGAIPIAPDDLHKANVSGGAPYEIAVPDLAADGRLLNERHNVYFVAYLRMVFRCGGFSGYAGIDNAVPPEIAKLSEGLLEF